MIYAIVCLALILADQLSKALAFALYDGGETVSFWLGRFLGINNVYNEGISFSIGADGAWTQPVVIVLTCIASAVLIFFLCKLPKDRRFLRWSLAVILAGAVGNLIDRVAIGAVRDFLFMDFGFTRFSNNVADLEITVGAILFIVALLFVDRDAVFRMSKKEEEAEVEEAVEELEEKDAQNSDRAAPSDASAAPSAEPKQEDCSAGGPAAAEGEPPRTDTAEPHRTDGAEPHSADNAERHRTDGAEQSRIDSEESHSADGRTQAGGGEHRD